MLNEIEKAVKDRIDLKIAEVKKTLVQKGASPIALTSPAVFVSCEEGKFKKQGQTSYQQSADVFVEIEFKDLSSEEARRRGALLIVKALVQYLILQKLDLKILPLEPVRWAHITDKDDISTGIARFQIVFSTAFSIEAIDDEAVTDLLRVGLNYLLKPGDDVVDATDLVELAQ